MRYDLFREGSFWKANLHCHTTVSDGKLTPAEVKEYYMAHGYSVVAYTDHNVIVPHQDLRSPDFLPLNGCELFVNENRIEPGRSKITCHMNIISPREDYLKMVCWNSKKYIKSGNSIDYVGQVVTDPGEPDYERCHTVNCVNDMARRAREAGYFVIYNHPTWSHETYPMFSRYRYFHAMEIYNNCSFLAGYNEYSPEIYDEMLRSGSRLYAVASDDNHDKNPDFTYRDSCGGWVMIKAPELTYPAIMKSLFSGNFYASTGPEIHELYIENEMIHVRCSPAVSISIQRDIRANGSRTPVPGREEFLTEATFKLNRNAAWFRITVTDDSGCHANSRAYFTDELPADTADHDPEGREAK